MRHEAVEVDDVTIEVRNGEVAIEGSVPERWMKYVIENIADACYGVKHIENRLRIADHSAGRKATSSEQRHG